MVKLPSNSERKKMKRKHKELPKARNPFVQHLINKRGSGVHERTKKAERRDAKMALKQHGSVAEVA